MAAASFDAGRLPAQAGVPNSLWSFQGCLLGGAVDDAVGAPVKFKRRGSA